MGFAIAGSAQVPCLASRMVQFAKMRLRKALMENCKGALHTCVERAGVARASRIWNVWTGEAGGSVPFGTSVLGWDAG